MNANGFLGHKLDCHTQLARMVFDVSCPRCAQIKKVVALRRKTTENGASEEEETAAQMISDALVTKYGLTRGEVYDRLYTPPPTLEVYKADIVWAERKKKKRGRNDFSDIHEIG